jgi:hypothetical protein
MLEAQSRDAGVDGHRRTAVTPSPVARPAPRFDNGAKVERYLGASASTEKDIEMLRCSRTPRGTVQVRKSVNPLTAVSSNRVAALGPSGCLLTTRLTRRSFASRGLQGKPRAARPAGHRER